MKSHFYTVNMEKNNRELIIRPFEEGDWQAICRIHDEARMIELQYAGLEQAFLPLWIAADREGLFDYTVEVAEFDGSVAGFIAYEDGEVGWLYVDPARHGHGIGGALVDRACDRSRKPLTLEVLVGNESARAMYEHKGFSVRKTISGRMPGNESFSVTVYEMQK